jgi:ATP-binding protein involved in chromosome partitioning
VPLLAQIPLTPLLREGGDDGRPIAAVSPDSEAGRAFHELAEKVEAMKPKKIFSKGLKLL